MVITLGVWKLIYIASVLVIREQLIKEINSIIFNFIRDGKPAKIKSPLILSRKQGGVRITDFDIENKALKVSWIPRLNSGNEGSWKIIPEAALEKHGVYVFLTTITLTHYRLNIYHPFT